MKPEPHERPILFSAPMVRAILEGRKTQTRRILNEKTLKVDVRGTVCGDYIFASTVATGRCKAHIAMRGAVSALAKDGKMLGVKPGEFDFVCPYADGETILENMGNDKSRWRVMPRDSRLWVKETFKQNEPPSGWIYRATDEASINPRDKRPWRPSIFMPRKRSRITLEITNVRVERLHDITEKDAIAEGCDNFTMDEGVKMWSSATEAYAELWDSINGDGAWNANPWVWRIEFKRIKP